MGSFFTGSKAASGIEMRQKRREKICQLIIHFHKSVMLVICTSVNRSSGVRYNFKINLGQFITIRSRKTMFLVFLQN